MKRQLNAHREWTMQNFATLRQMQAAGHTDDEIAVVLDRTPCAVANKRRILGIHPSRWTASEERTIRDNPDRGGSQLTDLLPGRDAETINRRRCTLGIRTTPAWTDRDVQIIRENLHLTDVELGQMLGRTRGAICTKRDILGLQKRGKKMWTDAEVEYLRCNLGKISRREMAAVLGRSEASVRSKQQGFDK